MKQTDVGEYKKGLFFTVSAGRTSGRLGLQFTPIKTYVHGCSRYDQGLLVHIQTKTQVEQSMYTPACS